MLLATSAIENILNVAQLNGHKTTRAINNIINLQPESRLRYPNINVANLYSKY